MSSNGKAIVTKDLSRIFKSTTHVLYRQVERLVRRTGGLQSD
jgi:hypothetical protein